MIFGFNFANGFNFSDVSSSEHNSESLTQTNFQDLDKIDENVLKNNDTRDISYLYSELKTEDEYRAKLAEEAQKKHDEECILQGINNKKSAGNPDDGVDFSVGRQRFIETWAPRIDDYLKGFPLEGQGEIFANAAFEYGVDPRVSPAIANTESTRGTNCFRPYNAWGWMGSNIWSSWESAINDHVKEFSQGYGYTISLSVAMAYCPPTYQEWYSTTSSQMSLI